MSLASGTRLGPYEILSAIGAGGMGEVYRAKDTRLDRIVAIKVLPSHLSSNPQLRQRFEREARAISSITHPHICSLYDIGHQNGTDYLVMEFLEGESLAKRLDKGSVPTEQVLKYGIQIAEALDRAHRQGIVHRDLKPGNIMITKSGAKLLDFGLAKYQMTAEADSASELLTRDRPLTEEGVVLGTVQYMAPEQIEGKESDARTDIFALGEVLYEMSTGQRTFKGNSKAQLMASIMTSDPPPISTVQPLAPPALDHVIKKCLAKDPEDRWQNAHDLASELRWISEQTSQSQAAAVRIRRARIPASIGWMLSAVLLLTTFSGAFFAVRYYRLAHSTIAAPISMLSFPLPEKTSISAPGAMAISPDGRYVAFSVINKQGRTSLWLRDFSIPEGHEIPGTDDAGYPFWSPDNHFIGFFSQGKLKKTDVVGGPSQSICDAPQARGGTWNSNGTILFSPTLTSGLYRVSPVEGEQPVEVTKTDATHKENSHRWPYFLPDGQHFLFTVRSAQSETRGIYIGSLNSKERKKLLPDQTKAEFVYPDYLMVVREGNLLAIPFDPAQLRVTGEPVSVAQKVDIDPGLSAASFSVSQNQSLIYMNSGSYSSQLFLFDRSGKQLGVLGEPTIYFMPVLSPDEKQVIVGIPDATSGGYDLWLIELQRGTLSRLTSNPASDSGAVWSPDSSKVMFGSNRNGPFDLYMKTIGGAGNEELLLHTNNFKQANDWSRDGRYILYTEIAPKTGADVWIFPMFEDRKPFLYLQTEFNEAQAVFSPDGKWIAYASDDTGRAEVYVQSFPVATATKRQVSTAGGSQPLWRRDQKELFYLAADGKLMAVPVEMNGKFEPGVPAVLFDTHFSYNPLSGGERTQYAVFGDGQRFLLNNIPKESSETPIAVILNWTTLLKK